MLTVLEIKTNLNKVFTRQTDDARNANIAILNYIDHMAKTTGVNIGAWDIGTMFKDPSNKKQSLELIKERNTINRIFFGEVERLKAIPNGENDRISLLLKSNLERISTTRKATRTKQIENELKYKVTHLDGSLRQTMEYIASIAKFKKELAELNGANTEDKIISDIQEICNGNFYEFLEINGSTITFITRNDIINTFKKPMANIDITVNLGKFKILFDMNSLAMIVKPYQNNIMVETSYCHPHVSNSGNICWGNVSGRASELLQKFDVKNALLLLATLLTTYNEEAPYVALVTFKEKKEAMEAEKSQQQLNERAEQEWA